MKIKDRVSCKESELTNISMVWFVMLVLVMYYAITNFTNNCFSSTLNTTKQNSNTKIRNCVTIDVFVKKVAVVIHCGEVQQQQQQQQQ